MAKKFTISHLFGVTSKSAKREAKKRRKRQEQIWSEVQKLKVAEQKRIAEQKRLIPEMESKGYVLVPIKSVEQFIKGAIISLDLLNEMSRASLLGYTEMFIHKDVLHDMENKQRKHEKYEQILRQCANLNNEGMAYEKEGKIERAIDAYEKNICSGYPAHHSFKRLMILYRKNKDYENEERVILRALEVFPNFSEYIDRLNKVRIYYKK